MSWFISLILAGSILTSGNNISKYEYQNAATNSPKAVTKTKLKTIKSKFSDETERFEKTYPFDPNGKIEVSNLNGSIYIEAWDRPEIHLVATKVADIKERLSEVRVVIEESQSNFVVKTDYKAWKDRTNKIYKSKSKYRNYGKLYVTFRLKVPRTASLDQIETVNGSVEVSNMTNYTGISAVNGAVKAANLRGTAKLSTVNGTVYADFDDLNDGSLISLGTVNGSVKLSLPSTANATVKANTVNGSISNEFGLPVRKGKYVGRDLYGRIGNGNVKIKLSSVNGGLSIKNKDGGATNPAVNLLKQKTSDDFDETFESEMNINIEKMNIKIDEAIKKTADASAIARRESRRAIRDARREQRKINREALRKVEEETERELREIGEDYDKAERESVKASEALYLSSRSPYIQEKSVSFEVVGIPKIVVNAEECDVLIRGWDKQEVKYILSRITKVGVDSKDLETKVRSSKSEVEINIEAASPFNKDKIRLEVFVPKKSNLKVTSERQIRLEGVSGYLELNGNNEPINVRDSYGNLKIESIDGTVRIIGFKGELESTSVDGDVYLEGYFKKIRSESNDGKVYLTLPDETNAMITTNNMGLKGNYKMGSKVSMGGLNLVKESETTWRVGKGGHKYYFDFSDGSLIVRPSSSISNK